jgi:hypothetical protein
MDHIPQRQCTILECWELLAYSMVAFGAGQGHERLSASNTTAGIFVWSVLPILRRSIELEHSTGAIFRHRLFRPLGHRTMYDSGVADKVKKGQ